MAFGGGQAEARGLSFGPAPDGFDMDLFDIGERDPSALSERGCCFWLSDTRLDASGPERVFTSRPWSSTSAVKSNAPGRAGASHSPRCDKPPTDCPAVFTVSSVWRPTRRSRTAMRCCRSTSAEVSK